MPLSEGWYSMFVAMFKLRAPQALNKMRDLSYGPEEVLKESRREPSCRQYFDTAKRPACREIPKSLSSLHTWRPKKISGATSRILPKVTPTLLEWMYREHTSSLASRGIEGVTGGLQRRILQRQDAAQTLCSRQLQKAGEHTAITKTRIVNSPITQCVVVATGDPLTVREIYLLIPINPIRHFRIRITCLTGRITPDPVWSSPKFSPSSISELFVNATGWE
jgi:hypothetical protein